MLWDIIFVVSFTAALIFSNLIMYKRGLNLGFKAGVVWMGEEIKKSIEEELDND